ncbi:MAG: ATP-grasp domain-containing protein [Acidimicrobiales bacterium]
MRQRPFGLRQGAVAPRASSVPARGLRAARWGRALSPDPFAPAAALVLDAEYKQALAAARSIGRAGGVVCLAASCPAAAEGWTVPALWSRWVTSGEVIAGVAHDPTRYAEGVLDAVVRRRTEVVLPASDPALAALLPWRSELEEHARLAVGAAKALEIALDKGETLRAASAAGVAVPVTLYVSDPRDAASAAAEVGYPAVVKPEAYSGPTRLVARAVLDGAEAREAVAAIVATGVPALVQPWASGRREAVQVFRTDGAVVAQVASVTSRATPMLGGASVVRESISLPTDSGRAAEALLDAIGLEGYAEVEFRRDAHGRSLLMEVNPRLSGSVELGVRAGVDFPLMLYNWAAGRRVEPVEGYRAGVRLRWLAGDLRWLAEEVHGRSRPDGMPVPRALSRFVMDFGVRQSYDVLDAGDVMPAVAEMSNIAVKLGLALAGRQRLAGNLLRCGPGPSVLAADGAGTCPVCRMPPGPLPVRRGSFVPR